MLGMMLLLASQTVSEVTPQLTSFSLTTGANGTCFTTPLQPATITVTWSASNYDSALYDFLLYRDGVLVNTTDSTSYGLQIAGLVEGDTHHPQDITFNYRIDIVRNSDSHVMDTRSLSSTKHYGNCV